MDNEPITVAAGLIVRDGRYLIARRKRGVHLEGLWEFPGGKLEGGETLEQGLRRELREELGVEITRPVPFRVIRHAYPEKTVELHFFSCGIASGEPQPIGCDDVRWVAPGELAAFDFPPADRPLLDALGRHEAAPCNFPSKPD